MPALEREIDRLYGLPLDEFTAARDALAKRLRGERDREAADRVGALRKPTVGAWALNQALGRSAADRRALIDSGERLRRAHAALLETGDRDELREATEAERALVAKLADRAEAIATEAGRGGPALRERLRSTLHAAALDEGTRAGLAAGRLEREAEAVGLGAGGPSPGAQSGRSGARRAGATKPAGGRSAAKERTSARRAAAAGRVAKAERRVGEALAAVEAARSKAAAATAAHERSRTAAERAAAAEREARQLADEATREAKRAGRALAKAERELERLGAKAG